MVRLVVLSGEGEAFCSGMDFVEASSSGGDSASLKLTVEAFYGLMERFTTSSSVIASLVTGRVTAGGVGLVAASGYVIAGRQASFQLSEVIFGFLPATVAPFTVRRCGMQAAFRLSLTAQRIGAVRAAVISLVDEVADAPADALRQFMIRAARVEPGCVADLKGLFRDMRIIDEDTPHRRRRDHQANPAAGDGSRHPPVRAGRPIRRGRSNSGTLTQELGTRIIRAPTNRRRATTRDCQGISSSSSDP